MTQSSITVDLSNNPDRGYTNTKPQSATQERDPLDLIAEALNSITDNAKYWEPVLTAQHAQSVIVEHVRAARTERDALRERVAELEAGARELLREAGLTANRLHCGPVDAIAGRAICENLTDAATSLRALLRVQS